MSTVIPPGPPHDTPPTEDRFRYGWRYRKTVGPDGVERLEQIPLTLEDVHHPQEEDFIVQRGGHAEDCIYLHDALQAHLGDRALVTFDLRIAWDTPGVEPLGPDVTVIFDGVYDPDRGTFDCAAEGQRPTVVFEVVSPETRVNDVGPKVSEYYEAGVEWYAIIDALGFRDGMWDLRVIGYRWTPEGYEEVSLDARHWLWVEPLRLYVAVRGGRVVCYNEAGEEFLQYAQVVKARQAERRAWELAEQQRQAAEEARAAAEKESKDERRQREAEEQARQQAEQERKAERRQRQAAEKAQRQAEQERQAAEKAQRQAEQERQAAEKAQRQAEQERQAAEKAQRDLEERLRQLEEELRRLRDKPNGSAGG